MDYRLPYYMAYPMPLLYDDEKLERRDMEYMKSLYPEEAKRLLPYVEAECDRMEYEGSMVFDEYPDQLQLRMMCGRIYNRIQEMQPLNGGDTYYPPQMEGQSRNRRRDESDWRKDLVMVMLYQELYKRRCDHRHCRRKLY